MHPFVHILGQSFYWYDLINAFIVIPVTGLYFYFAFSSLGIKKGQIVIFLLVGYAVENFGGWLIPLYYRMVMLHQTQWIYTWNKPPGRFFHSVVLVHLFFALLNCWIWRWPVRKVLDRWIIAIMMGSAIGRIGCWTFGCCYGKPSTLPWPLSVHVNMMPLEVTRYPTQAVMFLAETALTVYLWFYLKKRKYDGEVFWRGVLLYSIYRFLIEFLRTNQVVFSGLTHAQLFSAVTFVLSIVVLSASKENNAQKLS